MYLGRETRYPMIGVTIQKEDSLLSNLRYVAVILDKEYLKKYRGTIELVSCMKIFRFSKC